jgi:hypothetical protein
VEQGYGRREAIEHAAAIRLRPILMTTAAMVVAMVPLLIAKGAGAASRFDIGVVIAAGMTIGTLFTLFVTPAVYTYLARDHQKAKARAAVEVRPEVPEAASHPARASAAAADAAEAEFDAAAEAGVLFPAEPEPPSAEDNSAEVLAFSSAAAAASGQENRGRKTARRPPRRKPLTPAAE